MRIKIFKYLIYCLLIIILPVTKDTYYSNIEVTSKEKQDGTILETELNDLKMIFSIIRKMFIKFYYESNI